MLSAMKNILIVLVMFIIAFGGYVLIINRNSVNMTGRQKVLRPFIRYLYGSVNGQTKMPLLSLMVKPFRRFLFSR